MNNHIKKYIFHLHRCFFNELFIEMKLHFSIETTKDSFAKWQKKIYTFSNKRNHKHTTTSNMTKRLFLLLLLWWRVVILYTTISTYKHINAIRMKEKKNISTNTVNDAIAPMHNMPGKYFMYFTFFLLSFLSQWLGWNGIAKHIVQSSTYPYWIRLCFAF